MKQISIVIPVYNEEKFIDGLLSSIQKINYPTENYETIVVSDGSTDHTVDVVKCYPEARLIELPQNMGRYQARKKGAEAAKNPYILFIDSRSVVDPSILTVLNQLDAKAVNGYSLGVKIPGIFETFYTSIRRIVFHKFYSIYNQPFYLTLENFDSMPKGTGVLYVEKGVLFDAFNQLSLIDMGKDSSDDTKLLRTIISKSPILVHPEVKIINFARPSFHNSVIHLYKRGTKFVDYYLNPTQRNFWLVIILPLLALTGILAGLIFVPLSGLTKLILLIILDVLIALFLSRTIREFYINLFMLPLCVLVFYAGIIRGIMLKWLKISNEKKRTVLQ